MANSYSDVSVLILTFIVGATVLVLVYITNLFKAPRDGDSSKSQETQQSQRKAKSSSDVNSSSQKSASASSKKKQQQQQQQQHSEKWNRDSKQNYTHPWLLTSLKGHSGTVLDMDFSSNGKFLATCAEEDTEELDPGGDGSEHGNSSGSEGNKENNPQESNGCKGALLSRRQKKNRVRRNDGSPVSRNNVTTKKNRSKSRRNNGGAGDGHNRRNATPALRQHTKLNLADRDLSILLRNYILSPDELLGLGYPVESALYPGRAVIFRNPGTNSGLHTSTFVSHVPHPHPLTTSSHFFDVNAREFVPMSAKTSGPYYFNDVGQESASHFNDVGQESASPKYVSSLVNNQPGIDYSEIGAQWNASHENKGEDQNAASSGSDSGINKSECEDSSSASQEPSDADCTIEEDQGIMSDPKCKSVGPKSLKSRQKGRVVEDPVCVSDEKKCVRCGKGFFVTNDGEYLTQEHCLYHWGKLQRVVGGVGPKFAVGTVRMEYSCCRGRPTTRGCTTGKLHVWNGVGYGINGPFESYVRTRPRKTPPPDGNYGVYALDCEMCFTVRGLELTKVTVVAADGRLVYDCLVRPENYIIDYNTRFSGITARDLNRRGATKSLKDVQNDLMGFINAETILIGHGLENDLRALRIIHGTVIDTSIVFPHYYGLPYRRSLKSLVGCLLKRDIQQDSSGHDSFEDARACVELMLWRLRKDFISFLES